MSRPAPERPTLVSAVPPPTPPPAGPVPRVLRVAALLWTAAVVAGAAALVTAAVDLDASRARLTATAAEQDPQAPAALLRSGVATTLLLPTGAVLAALLVGTGCLVALVLRRSWARWVTGVLAAVGCAGAVIAAGVLEGGPLLDEAGFLACAVALAGATALVATRPVGRWLAVGR